MRTHKFFSTTLCVLSCLALTGCPNPDARYASVEGTITYNGVPVEGATVNFFSTSEDGESGSGRTNENGRFTMTSLQASQGGAGLLPGEYTVTVSKREMPVDPDSQAYEAGTITYNELQQRIAARGGGAMSSGASTDLLPARYARPATTPLTAMVVAGRNSFDFELTGQ